MKLNDVRSTTILLVGSGRLALHLKHWNSLLSKPNHLIFWNRSQNEQILQQQITQADLVWLAISDSSLIPFYEKHFLGSQVQVVHFSGALYDSRIASAHPMMSFPNELISDSIYENIGFAIQGADHLQQLMPGFNNQYFQISAADKPFYHALCVISGNFPQLLWNEVSHCLPGLKIPDSIYHTYLSQVLRNFLVLKEKSLTGPLVRKDDLTIQKNEDALSSHPKLQNIYRTFTKEFSQ